MNVTLFPEYWCMFSACRVQNNTAKVGDAAESVGKQRVEERKVKKSEGKFLEFKRRSVLIVL